MIPLQQCGGRGKFFPEDESRFCFKIHFVLRGWAQAEVNAIGVAGKNPLSFKSDQG